jgi:hypothetical protein
LTFVLQKRLQAIQKGDAASKRAEKIEIINTLKRIDPEIRALTADVTKRVNVVFCERPVQLTLIDYHPCLPLKN